MKSKTTSNTFRLRDAKGIYRSIPTTTLIESARQCIISTFNKDAITLQSPTDTGRYLQTLLGAKKREIFAAVFLDNRHRVIEYRELFRGTIDGCSVYPREVVKAALETNAAAVLFAHNHPSQISEPSTADEAITRRLRDALALVDIRVLDQLVIGATVTSMAERGLL